MGWLIKGAGEIIKAANFYVLSKVNAFQEEEHTVLNSNCPQRIKLHAFFFRLHCCRID